MSGISITIVGREEVIARFENARSRLGEILRSRMLREMAATAEYVRAEKLSGQVVKNRTGTLRRSIHPDAELSGGAVVGIVGSNLKYAKWLESGSKPHTIVPVNAKVLAFMSKTGEMVFARKVNHPGTAGRHFLASSMQERRARTIAGLREAALGALGAK